MALIFGIQVTLPSFAKAAMACALLLQEQRVEVKKFVLPDAYHQWILWEQTANVAYFRKDSAPVELPYSILEKSQLDIEIDPNTPKIVQDFFVNTNTALWVKHPHNTKKSVPFMDTTDEGHIQSFYSASRSMVLSGKLRGFTLKAPTNRPHGPNGELQSSKADTSADVQSALLHSAHINKQDIRYGEDPVLRILPEIMTVAEKESKIGYVIRDVRQTDDGHYYLPALSIPYVGREIAKFNQKPFEDFWLESFAKPLGEAKARLLLRYGIEMETPNAQNMLVQLDRNLRPTGRIFFRDVSDAFFVDVVAHGLGFQEAVKKDITVDYKPHKHLKPFISNSLWRFDEAGNLSVSNQALENWKIEHNRAYTKYVLQTLGLDKTHSHLIRENYDGDELPKLYKLLKSPTGQKALENYKNSIDQKIHSSPNGIIPDQQEGFGKAG